MSPRKPVQKRSRERIEQILLGAAEQLAKTGNPNDLTTTSVAKRSGVPVATIYRYFADRGAIISELTDREMAQADKRIMDAVNRLDPVNLAGLMEAMMMGHYEYFKTNRRAIVLWFGARQSQRVLRRVDGRYRYMGEWLLMGSLKAGFVVPEAPPFGGELLAWMGDRVFEYMFREERTDDEELAILREWISTMNSQIDKYATPLGREGVPSDVFLEAAGEFRPPSPDD